MNQLMGSNSPKPEIKSEKMEVEEEEEPNEEKSAKEVKTVDQLSPEEKAQQSTIEKLTKILSGEKSIFFHLQVIKTSDSCSEDVGKGC